jgi:hypothetical protein
VPLAKPLGLRGARLEPANRAVVVPPRDWRGGVQPVCHGTGVGDINGDGLTDIIVGKRRWAHGPNKDIEPGAAPVLYWFQLQRTADGVRFRPHLVDDWSGVGLQVVGADVTGDGVPDILTVSKLGVFLFVTRRGPGRSQ